MGSTRRRRRRRRRSVLSSLPGYRFPAVVERQSVVEAGDSLRTAKDMIMTMTRGLKTVIRSLVRPRRPWRACSRRRCRSAASRTAERRGEGAVGQLLPVGSRASSASTRATRAPRRGGEGGLRHLRRRAPGDGGADLRLALWRHLGAEPDAMCRIRTSWPSRRPRRPGEVRANILASRPPWARRRSTSFCATSGASRPSPVIDAHADPGVAAALDSTSPAPRRPRPLLVVLPRPRGAAAAAAAGGAASPFPRPPPRPWQRRSSHLLGGSPWWPS